MALQITKAVLILLAVFGVPFTAKLIFLRNWDDWFRKKERGMSPFGVPVANEGFIIFFVLIAIVVVLLMIINNYF